MIKNVLLYSDTGADLHLNQLIVNEFTDRGYSVDLTDAAFLTQKSWEENTTLLIMPGGRDVPYHQKLQGKANKRIRAYVAAGGRYFGICAGAYYGARRVEFDKGCALEVCQDRELGFFPQVAVGPAFGPGTFHYRTESGCRAAVIDYATESYVAKASLFYNGGCVFACAEEHPDVKVLAQYSELSPAAAAIVLCSVGKGKALLSGVHIEQGIKGLKGGNAHHQRVAGELAKSEKKRQLIFDDLLGCLGIAL